jgi:hypothetical protein
MNIELDETNEHETFLTYNIFFFVVLIHFFFFFFNIKI